MDRHASPYLSSSWRLADVLAAIQVMGAYAWAGRTTEAWTEKLGKPLSAETWLTVYQEHPEFFRVNDEGVASLRWRHGYDRNFSFELGRELTKVEIEELSPEGKNNVTRKALAPDQIEALLKTAIELHSRAVAYAQERRWLTPLLFALFGVILGAILQAALK